MKKKKIVVGLYDCTTLHHFDPGFFMCCCYCYAGLATPTQNPRTENFMLTRSPFILVALIGSYLYFCLKAGPRFMESRKPYELKKTILIYNLFQILLSFYISYHATRIIWQFDWRCQPIDHSDTPFNNELLSLSWLYAFAKITELLDTVFFVLRKKFNQISFLHLFHHTVMASLPCSALKYLGSGHGVTFGLLNSYVHVVMYTYYLIANLGPEYRKYLWWKKYLTILQLIQFVMVFIHNLIPLLSSCSYPKHVNIVLILFSVSFFYMFSRFYIDTYMSDSKRNKDVKNK